mmetsp:Transcript_104560/g.292993  ORF Transcript_104560/g.292993 Transcript_104560/m.292993 type:complete len:209 (+) Transcript_104560:782-1408(+)
MAIAHRSAAHAGGVAALLPTLLLHTLLLVLLPSEVNGHLREKAHGDGRRLGQAADGNRHWNSATTDARGHSILRVHGASEGDGLAVILPNRTLVALVRHVAATIAGASALAAAPPAAAPSPALTVGALVLVSPMPREVLAVVQCLLCLSAALAAPRAAPLVRLLLLARNLCGRRPAQQVQRSCHTLAVQAGGAAASASVWVRFTSGVR